MTYLEQIGATPAEAVQLVVVTHWDDDHVRGIFRTVETCEAADVACSIALAREDVIQFVMAQGAALGSESGVDELRSILLVTQERGHQIVWAKANTPLHPLPPGDTPIVVALSPSDDAYQRGVTELIQRATELKSAIPRRYRAPEGPNGSSIVTSVRKAQFSVLLGGDLEHSNNANTGWMAIIDRACPPTKASLVKVPHHGSEDAHYDGMWTELVADEPLAIVTPFMAGDHQLPGDRELSRLKRFARRLFVTASPTLVRARYDSDVEKLVRDLHGKRIRRLRGWGHVRARRKMNGADEDWRIEVAGDAHQVV